MIEDTIAKLEQQLKNAESLSPAQRAELDALLAELKAELAVARQTSARRESPQPTSVHEGSPLDKLSESVAEFETTHPQLVAIVNRISTVLANMGI